MVISKCQDVNRKNLVHQPGSDLTTTNYLLLSSINISCYHLLYMPFISYLAVGPGLPLHLGVVPVSSLNDPVHILITLIYGDHAFKCKLGDLEAYYVDIELTTSGDLPPEYTQV